MPNAHTLGRTERLKSRKQLDRLFQKGRAFSMPPLRVLYFMEPVMNAPKPIYLQAGVGVSSRNFKKAVDRNLIKRRMRESYRLQRSFLEPLLKERSLRLDLFFIFTGRELPQYADLSAKMLLALQKMEKEIGREQGTK